MKTEFEKKIRGIFAHSLEVYLKGLKKFEKDKHTSSYDEGYYDGLQKAIDIIKN